MDENAPQRDLKGMVTGDPLADLPIGASISAKPVVFGTSDAQPIPLDVSNWSFFEGALLAVALRDADGTRILGTAVMVAPGLAMTATHVLTDDMTGLMDGSVFGLCVGQ